MNPFPEVEIVENLMGELMKITFPAEQGRDTRFRKIELVFACSQEKCFLKNKQKQKQQKLKVHSAA